MQRQAVIQAMSHIALHAVHISSQPCRPSSFWAAPARIYLRDRGCCGRCHEGPCGAPRSLIPSARQQIIALPPTLFHLARFSPAGPRDDAMTPWCVNCEAAHMRIVARSDCICLTCAMHPSNEAALEPSQAGDKPTSKRWHGILRCCCSQY
jgi:hypothetical protein